MIGFALTYQGPRGRDPRVALAELLEQARHAEAAGFDALWVSHHHVADLAYLQPVALLARLAAEVQRATLGISIFLLPLHRPVDMAEQFASLDVITGGRLVVGVAQGYRPEEYEALGVPMEHRGPRLEEHVRLLRRLWSEETVTVRGRFTRLDNVSLALRPLQPGGPPLWIGATAEAAIRRAARTGDGWISSNLAGFEETARRVRLFRRSLAEFGRPADLPVQVGREGFCGRSREEAVAIARPPLAVKYGHYAAWGRNEISVDALLETACVLGSPEDCIEQLSRYRAELSVDHVALRMQWPGVDHRDVLRSIELFGERVLPTVRRTTATAHRP